jgi:hypothetical protein
MFVGDHPRVLPAHRHQTVVLDRAIAEDGELYARLEEVLHGKVHSATISELDLVNDKTIVDVRYAYSPAVFPPPAVPAVPASISAVRTAAPAPAFDAPSFDTPAAAPAPAHAPAHAQGAA